jgi:hypothetical protein
MNALDAITTVYAPTPHRRAEIRRREGQYQTRGEVIVYRK